MYHKHIDEARFIAAHASGLRDRELAQLFGLSLATTKRRKHTLGLGSNCAHNNRGRLAEDLVAAHVRQQGLSVTPAGGHNPPYDLHVNGWRVEVKVGQQRPSGAVQFRLPAQRGSNSNQYRYVKDYQRDADFIALVVLSGARLEAVYVLPTTLWRETITLRPTSAFCPYRTFLDAWSPLRTAARTAA